jgi:hypothetical protein
MKAHKNYTKIVFNLYFFRQKRNLALILMIVRTLSLYSQDERITADSIIVRQDSVVTDTINILRKISADAIDKEVTYKALGYVKSDLINKKTTLVRVAEVNYGDIQIKADSVVFNMATNVVFAVGVKDSSGIVIGRPAFKSGSQEFEADTLRYNFKTGKAVVKNIITKQDEGLLHSSVTKLLEDGTSNIYKSTYSTCDADTPHFYINLPKAKVYPGEKIISGPGNLVLEGIPLPLYLPFGYFPVQTKRAASGILIPKQHYEEGRGYALTDGGYYFAINNYFDLTLMTNIFTNGSWLATARTSYNKLYKYSGNFSFSYAKNLSGHKGLSDYREAANYNVSWTYTQNPKARPGSRFSASVNMSSSGFDRNNSYSVSEHITTQRQSSVSYSKIWEGTPFNFSASMNHSQNVKNQTVSLNLPRATFNVARIYPLKGKNSAGPAKWWQEVQFQYSASLDNQINTHDSLMFTSGMWKDARSGFSHEIPLSFQIRPFRNFSISPQVSYKGVVFTQKIIKKWVPGFKDPESGKIVPSVISDTLHGYFYGQAINPSISAGYSPQIFGTFTFRPESRLQAIRHVMKPTVSFSFVPSLSGLSSKMYRQVQIDTSRRIDYSIYDGNLYSTPSLSRKNGSVSFGLTNILEAKVFEPGDTTGKPKRIKLIDNFGINTSYNIFADSLKWAPLSMVMRTTLFEKINISANSNFSFYGLDSKGRQIGTFYHAQTQKLMRLNNVSLSLDFSLSDLIKVFTDNKKKAASSPAPGTTGVQSAGAVQGAGPASGPGKVDSFGYPQFNVPWTMNLSYSINYAKPGITSQIIQSFSVNGTVALTKKMNITYTSGYDFSRNEITMTQIGISRDLHCWDMRFDWIPNGYMKMWTFTIRVKASVLSDLKYERRKDYHDNY